MATAQQAATNQSQEAQGKQWSINKQQEAITGQLSSARADKASADSAANQAATNQAGARQEVLGAVGSFAQAGVGNMQDGGNFFTGK